MKIALIGYGKMGKIIEQIALDRGHEIVLKIDISNQNELTVENLKKADVAIEFTVPSSATANYKLCFDAGIPVVSGTTGWLERKDEVEAEMKAKNGTFFYASNFSLGVNLFFALNKKLAQLMNGVEGYDVSMVEVHHTQKLDAPSGTAITLAEELFENYPAKTSWTMEHPKSSQEMHIGALREGTVPGIHRIKYESDVDYIQIEHSAKSRHGFAFGAVLAAEYSFGKKGLLSMNDLLNL
ncbi:4-hydroxy-tetrahydrodipicolinate reductase [Mangrovibacterium diazotrophicum]|uniref:4-hydroxy-tetrahydrodipicolinate reductase n=1 Tax=Mangrovibacterium diazotrophicum TaxID=1261403 RepID=A0A419W4W3_9BACT|nr:4-hydroxy-tetrahydrodipicolinate reductase [Mangrovibacterium diazotrophicum]RKD90494.1 dihydrodipicolinate reductase [Mangrovibacterium diazotrophicum]